MGYFFYRPQLPHLILQFTTDLKIDTVAITQFRGVITQDAGTTLTLDTGSTGEFRFVAAGRLNGEGTVVKTGSQSLIIGSMSEHTGDLDVQGGDGATRL